MMTAMHEPHAARRVLGGRAGAAQTAAAQAAAAAEDVEQAAAELPAELVRDVERGGYYPALVTDVVQLALAGEVVNDHLVHLETTFDTDEVRRHVTVMVLTDTRLLVAHVDDHPGEDGPDAPDAPDGGARGTPGGQRGRAGIPGAATSVAASSVESVPLHQVGSVVVSHRVVDPARHRAGQLPAELVLSVGWGSLRRVDLEPATCGDPDCEADHGYTGTVAGEDVSLRVSADAEGAEAVRSAARFARSLTTASLPGAVAAPGGAARVGVTPAAG